MKKILLISTALISSVFLYGCGTNNTNINQVNNSQQDQATSRNETVDVSVSQKEGANVYTPNFKDINSRGDFRTVSVSNNSNTFIFVWSESINISKVWKLNPSLNNASMIFSSQVINGKLENLPLIVSWSPDEAKIMMVLRDGNSIDNIYTINADGSGFTQLTHFNKDSKSGVGDINSPIWDKSRGKIFFTGGYYKDSEKTDFYNTFSSVDAESKEIKEIGGIDGELASYNWLTDKDIIFLLHPNHPDNKPFSPDTNLFVLDTQTGVIKPFTTDGKVTSPPSVSPDGTRVAFFASSNNSPFYPILIISDPSGNILQRIDNFKDVPSSDFSSSPVWSPDGKQIVFITTTDTPLSGESISVIDLVSSEVKRNLLSDLKPGLILKWGKDGKIYLASHYRINPFIVYSPN